MSRNINGIEAIQCLTIEIKTRPAFSDVQVFPIHRRVVSPIYQNTPVQETVTLINHSSVPRTFRIDKVKADTGLNATALETEGVLASNSEKQIPINFYL